MSIKHAKVVVLLLLVHLGTRSTVKLLNIFTSEFFRNYSCKMMGGAVNRNTPRSPPVCSMFNETAQKLKFFMFFPGVTITTSVT